MEDVRQGNAEQEDMKREDVKREDVKREDVKQEEDELGEVGGEEDEQGREKRQKTIDLDALVELARAHIPFPRSRDTIEMQTNPVLRQQRLALLKSLNLSSWNKKNAPYDILGTFNAEPPHLGLLPITLDLYDASGLTLAYCFLAKAKARRHDMQQDALSFYRANLPSLVRQCVESYATFRQQDLFAASLEELETELHFKIYKFGGANLFPACLAAAFYNEFRATRVLDMSAGWGDRLVAACACDVEYVGVDPSTEMQPCYRAIINDNGNVAKQAVLHAPFEDAELGHEKKFDMFFSSPPFFKLEIYNDEPTQSVAKYSSAKAWVEQFLWRSLEKADRHLEPGATIVLHMCDLIIGVGRKEAGSFRSELQENVVYVDQTLYFATNTLNWSCRGCYGYVPCLRDTTNYKLYDGKAHAQPLWVFTKNF